MLVVGRAGGGLAGGTALLGSSGLSGALLGPSGTPCFDGGTEQSGVGAVRLATFDLAGLRGAPDGVVVGAGQGRGVLVGDPAGPLFGLGVDRGGGEAPAAVDGLALNVTVTREPADLLG